MAEDNDSKKSSLLSDLIGALLIDLARAQHMSNEYSKKLADTYYTKDPLLRPFPVPNGHIAGCEVELHLGVEGVCLLDSTPVSLRERASRSVSAMIGRLAPRIGASVASALRSCAPSAADPDRVARMADALGQGGLLASLGQNVDSMVQPELDQWIDRSGHLLDSPASTALESAFFDVFVGHEDYGVLSQQARQELRAEIQKAVSDELGTFSKRLEERPLHAEPAVTVTTSGERLSSLDPRATSQIRLTANVRDFEAIEWKEPSSSQPGSPPIARFKIMRARQ